MSRATNTGDSDVVRFAVRARPDREAGGAAVRDFYGLSATDHVFLRHRFDPVPGRPFCVHGALRALPGLGLASLTCSASHLERTHHDLHDDDLLLNITRVGERAAWHCGREVVFGHGEGLLSAGSQASKNTFADSSFISFRVPFKPIAAVVPNVEDQLCRPIHRDNGPLQLAPE